MVGSGVVESSPSPSSPKMKKAMRTMPLFTSLPHPQGDGGLSGANGSHGSSIVEDGRLGAVGAGHGGGAAAGTAVNEEGAAEIATIPHRRRRYWAWAFDARAWSPDEQEWERLLATLQPEEQTRVRRFHFPIDARRALAGRVMIRVACAEAMGVAPQSIKLGRSDKGKPLLLSPKPGSFSFNLSHHGSWVVLAAHTCKGVGVDVMEYEMPRGGRGIGDFFKTMKDSFTEDEWRTIKTTEADQVEMNMHNLEQFYKFWSLKESYIKAIGIGIGFGLKRASFQLLSNERAQLILDGKHDETYAFSIQALDATHCVGVALEQQPLKKKTAAQDEEQDSLPFAWQVLTTLFFSAQSC